MKRAISGLVIVVLWAVGFATAVEQDQAVCIVGTANVEVGAPGILDSSDEDVVKFGAWQIPYSKIDALRYGQKVRDRAVLLSIFTYTQKRHHYLTVQYTDDGGKEQIVVFEVGKRFIVPVLKTLETRSGKKVVYENKEAQESVMGKSSQAGETGDWSSSRRHR